MIPARSLCTMCEHLLGRQFLETLEFTCLDFHAPLGVCDFDSHMTRSVHVRLKNCVNHSSVVDPRRGLGKGWKDENAAPFFVGIQTIRHTEPVVFGLECVAWNKSVRLLWVLFFDIGFL